MSSPGPDFSPASPESKAASDKEASKAEGTGTIPQSSLSPAIGGTEYQPPEARQQSADLSGTVVQRLGDRLLSGTISRQMQAAGYKLIQPIGEGTFGVVWLAEHESTSVRVAIKFFAHGGGEQWQKLQEEVLQLAKLDSAQGIVHLKDAVANADPPYYVMSYAEGGSLAQRLEKGPVPVSEALTIFQDIVQALAYVHAHGIRHCDLKPGNILLDRLGKPLVADFGQAHLSNNATPALGTFFYMAPEQADLGSQIPDTRWDVYGLGALFYAMLTGQPPRMDPALTEQFKRTPGLDERLRQYREGIARCPKPNAHCGVPGMDHRLANILDGCLELDPKKRLASADAVLQALQRRQVLRRNQPLMAVGMLVPLVVGTLLTVALVNYFVARYTGWESRAVLIQSPLMRDKFTAQQVASGLNLGLSLRISQLESLSGGKTGDALARCS